MSVKQVKVVTPGGDIKVSVGITPDTTAADVLREAGLDRGFFLFPSRGDKFFHGNEKIEHHVMDGEELYANPPAKVGESTPDLVGAIVVGAMMLILLVFVIIVATTAERQANQVTLSPPQPQPLTPERSFVHRAGWRRKGDWYYGKYSAGDLKLRGQIYFRSKWEFKFSILAPKKLIKACGLHQSCFIPKSEPLTDGTRWYEIHFSSRPESVSSGILAVQEMLDFEPQRKKEQAA